LIVLTWKGIQAQDSLFAVIAFGVRYEQSGATQSTCQGYSYHIEARALRSLVDVVRLEFEVDELSNKLIA